MFLPKFVKPFLAIAALCCLCACGEDEPGGGSENPGQTPGVTHKPEANLSVSINADGTASNGAVYSQIDGTTFFLDFVKYEVVDSHLEIIGYDNVELPKLYASVTIGGTTYKTRIVGREAFKYAKMTSVVLPETLTKIESSAFSCCRSLQSVYFSEELTEIGYIAFEDCTTLECLAFPETLTRIGDSAFSGCSSLKNIEFSKSLTTIGARAFMNCEALQLLNFPEIKIDYYAFYGCKSLHTIVFTGASKIGEEAFERCPNLQKIVFPENNVHVSSNAFAYCPKLATIELSQSSVKSTTQSPKIFIGYEAFRGCVSLKTMPLAMTEINNGAFRDCTALQTIEFSDSMSTISDYAFFCCTSLRNLDYPKNLTEIGDYAFNGCTSLESLIFPETLISIGVSAFHGCGLETVTFLGVEPPYLYKNRYGGYSFYLIPTVYVKAEAVEEYKKAWGRWGIFSEILPIE